MLDRLLKEKLSRLKDQLLNNDYRIENITITIVDEFVYVETFLKIGTEYIESVIRIKDMIGGYVYDNESVYNNIRSKILDIIEYEYRKQLVGVLNE